MQQRCQNRPIPCVLSKIKVTQKFPNPVYGGKIKLQSAFWTKKSVRFPECRGSGLRRFFLYRIYEDQNRDFKMCPVFREFRFREGPVWGGFTVVIIDL